MNREQRYQALIRDLALYELSVSKLGVIQDTSKRDLLLHQHELDAKKGQVQQKLQELKELESELNEEKVKRKHREQYDMLAGSILQVPDRASQTREMEALEKELQALENENAQLSEKLDLRKKQFHLLLHTIRALEQELDEKEGDVVAASVSGGGATTTTPLATETNTVK
eukprot:GEZU01015538.1.p1 GENE.GEZU01015538.1~~GEZU01015538.1.p1  ORF type:complete len:170 (-),score=40.19 GEZU01015538.1:11-520(-)